MIVGKQVGLLRFDLALIGLDGTKKASEFKSMHKAARLDTSSEMLNK